MHFVPVSCCATEINSGGGLTELDHAACPEAFAVWEALAMDKDAFRGVKVSGGYGSDGDTWCVCRPGASPGH